MENQKDPQSGFVPRYLPWLLGAVMLFVYCLTLNHWITLLNIGQVAGISGWTWQPVLSQPLLYIVTLPFHLLPAAEIPIALNLFSAVCAALVLVLLARSVAILPHDRTEIERQRERSDFSFLTKWPAWIPPVLAVLLAGLQLTFWEHATSFTGESFELLLFAAIIWQFLEYRLDEQEWRLVLTALIGGLGLADNYAFIGFFPVFIIGIIWLRGWSFFNLQFLVRMFFFGLLGVMMIFFLPLVAKLTNPDFQFTFWEALKPALATDWAVLHSITYGTVRYDLALLSLTSILPIFLIAIRWSANFGDTSSVGINFLKYVFYIVYAVFFVACVWLMLDPPFSPRHFNLSPSLTLYYLAALSIGYFCGYLLLVFGVTPTSRRKRWFIPILPRGFEWLRPVIVSGTFLVAAVGLGTLIFKNAPIIHSLNNDALLKYAEYTTKNLPPDGAIILSDNDGMASPQQPGQPIRALLIQAELAREGRAKNYLVVDTHSLNTSAYLHFLHRKSPDKWPDLIKNEKLKHINPVGLFSVINLLSKSNNLCYLNPSFGYYFESFYQEPHGLVYAMKKLPDDTLLPPPLTTNLIAENEKFWADVTASVSPGIESALDALEPQTLPRRFHPGKWLLHVLHTTPEPSPDQLYIGTVYSRALDFWGVLQQRAGNLDAAATLFTDAKKLNPNNIVAGINLGFNQKLRDKTPVQIDPSRVNGDQFNSATAWNSILAADGPFDEISFTYADAVILSRNGYFRQAVAPFTRVYQLMPGNLDTRFGLAQIYILNHLPDKALSILRDPMTEPGQFGLGETNSTQLNVLIASAYFQKNENRKAVRLLQTEMERHPEDNQMFTYITQAYFSHKLYSNALDVINRKLAQTPDDPQWIFGKGYADMQTTNYSGAITAFSRVLELQSTNSTARFNRALAYLDSGKLDAAQADYAQLQTVYTNSPQVAFGLGEIAWRQHKTNDAVRNYEIYLQNAPTNTAEATNVIERLKTLKR